MIYKPIASVLAALCLTVLLAGGAFAAAGDVLLGDVFRSGYDGWTDTIGESGANRYYPDWGVLLTGDKTLIESSDGNAGIGATGDNQHKPYVMVNSIVTPDVYTLSAQMASWDDDGHSIIFGYKDYQNYYRIGWRNQASDSLGFDRDTSMEKVVNGVITTLHNSTNPWHPDMDGTVFNPVVSVNGATGAYSLTVNGTPILSGTDSDLTSAGADLAKGRYGFGSWYELTDSSASLPYGLVVHSLSVDNGSDGSVDKVHTFSDAVVAAWRPLLMTNAEGNTGDWDGTEGSASVNGNFRQDFTHGSILQDSNGFTWASPTADNIDFCGPAVVIDEEGSEGWTDYEMKVRISCGDDEGPGVLVRVQEDGSFYRINFAVQTMGTNGDRAPAGLSIQKCVTNGEDPPTWTELFRDNQGDGSEGNPAPLFTYDTSTDSSTRDAIPFDLTVKVVGDTITVQIIDDPDGAATVINYDPVVDETDPLLSGSVGLTSWGAGYGGAMGTSYSAYGGIEGAPLVTAIPEPSMLVLLGLLGACSLAARRR